MRVFKFGGGVLQSGSHIVKAAAIVRQQSPSGIVVVVSALGKTTNLLEKVAADWLDPLLVETHISQLKQFHFAIAAQLFPKNPSIVRQIEALIDGLGAIPKTATGSVLYDSVVSVGEQLASAIVAATFQREGLPVTYVPAFDLVTTNKLHGEARVDFEQTQRNCMARLNDNEALYLTEGFIAADSNGKATTLGREGSDFSAAIIAASVKASSVIFWKDVPGVMTADPKSDPQATAYDMLPYQEVAEMTYYGASIIHPRTIRPLAVQAIPLYVKPFFDDQASGTCIKDCQVDGLLPYVVEKGNQVLVSCKTSDYAFIHESHLAFIFGVIDQLGISIHVMQRAATSFSFGVDFHREKVEEMIERLGRRLDVTFNTDLTLITVRYYTDALFSQYRRMEGVLLEQSSRTALQLLVRG